MRKLNELAAGPPASTPGTSPAQNSESSEHNPDIVVVDPGSKARAAELPGGQVEPLESQASSTRTITRKPGQSAWAAILEEIAPNLNDPDWQSRHGSVLGIMEISRYLGSSLPSSLLPLARRLLALLATDRFGDFVGDTVVAPVRETAAQALGVLLKKLDMPSVREVHETLMAMVRQSWARRGGLKETGERFAWEVRHSGLLGLKYEVAVRTDLLCGTVKMEDAKPDVELEGLDLLSDVVTAAILA